MRKFSPPMGGYFLAPAEGCSLRRHQKGPLGQKVIFADGQMDGQMDGQTDGRKMGLRELDTTVCNC